MKVNGYDYRTGERLFADTELADCFPDDPDGMEEARISLEMDEGCAFVGGGTAPLIMLVAW